MRSVPVYRGSSSVPVSIHRYTEKANTERVEKANTKRVLSC